VQELIKAINDNIETVNIVNEDGTIHPTPVIKLQYIAIELEEVNASTREII
jgi:hypothetical protein